MNEEQIVKKSGIKYYSYATLAFFITSWKSVHVPLKRGTSCQFETSLAVEDNYRVSVASMRTETHFSSSFRELFNKIDKRRLMRHLCSRHGISLRFWARILFFDDNNIGNMALSSRIVMSRTLCNLLKRSSGPVLQRALSSGILSHERLEFKQPAASKLTLGGIRSFAFEPPRTPVDVNEVSTRAFKVFNAYDKIDGGRVCWPTKTGKETEGGYNDEMTGVVIKLPLTCNSPSDLMLGSYSH